MVLTITKSKNLNEIYLKKKPDSKKISRKHNKSNSDMSILRVLNQYGHITVPFYMNMAKSNMVITTFSRRHTTTNKKHQNGIFIEFKLCYVISN